MDSFEFCSIYFLADQQTDFEIFRYLPYFFTALLNIARGKDTRQSSTAQSGSSSRGVDGNKNTNWGGGSCTHTNDCCKPWWRVDFGKTAVIYSVAVSNREDCCWTRLRNFNIRIGDSLQNNGNNNPSCGSGLSVNKEATKLFECRPQLRGRYLTVQSNIDEALTLCEVEAFGEFDDC